MPVLYTYFRVARAPLKWIRLATRGGEGYLGERRSKRRVSSRTARATLEVASIAALTCSSDTLSIPALARCKAPTTTWSGLLIECAISAAIVASRRICRLAVSSSPGHAGSAGNKRSMETMVSHIKGEIDSISVLACSALLFVGTLLHPTSEPERGRRGVLEYADRLPRPTPPLSYA
jgi:uncharacterized membrane protein